METKHQKIFIKFIRNIVGFFNDLSDKRRANKMVKRLYSLPKEEWLEIDHQFNSWIFPMEFREFMPKWWLENRGIKRSMTIISPLMKIIKNEFGDKEQLRFHNVFKGKMTDAEFEYWYENCSITKSNNSNWENFNKYYDRRSKIEKLKWWEDDIFNKLSNIL